VAATLRHTLKAGLRPGLKTGQGPHVSQAVAPRAGSAWRPGLAWLAIAGVALVFAPLFPGLYWALAPASSISAWQDLLASPEWPQALTATLMSTILATALAVLMAGAIAMLVYPGRVWQRLQLRLPLLLSVPHAAFAVGLFFLLAPSGWLARGLAQLLGWASPPGWVTVQDPFGLSLALALAIKESWFLLWVFGAVLGEQVVARQMTIACSLGYSRWQAWRHILWPQLLPRLGWPLAAVLAYGLSVVDMAVILGPSNPPTFAVLTWHWLTDASLTVQAQGSAAAIVMILLLLVAVLLGRGLWQMACRVHPYPTGRRMAVVAVAGGPAGVVWPYQLLFGIGYLVVAALLLWSIAGRWFFPAFWPDGLSLDAWLRADFSPFATSFWLAGVVCAITLPIALFWLEWGPARFNALLYLPLIVPALPLAIGQYAALLHVNLDGTATGVVWSHLLWVLPYMVLTLVGPYRSFDARLLTTAQAFGRSRLHACLTVKWPSLLKPILAAVSVGFAVSIAQYLPTLFAGGGRFATVTTEAVALSAGGNRHVLAVQAVLQVLLPLDLAAGPDELVELVYLSRIQTERQAQFTQVALGTGCLDLYHCHRNYRFHLHVQSPELCRVIPTFGAL